jgi:hypothetical protein
MRALADNDVLNAALLQWLDTLAQQGVFTTDRDHVIRSWNRWLELNTGYDAGDMIGRSVFTAPRSGEPRFGNTSTPRSSARRRCSRTVSIATSFPWRVRTGGAFDRAAASGR